MQQVFHLKGADGEDYDVPNSELENFRKAMPDAVGVGSYRGKDGSEYDVPDSERENFQSAVPDAQPTRRLSFADGSTRDFTMPELSKFLRSKEWREDERYAADREDARQRNEAAHPGLAQDVDMSSTTGAIETAAKGGLRAAGKELGAFAGVGTGLLRLAGAALGGRGGWAMDAANWIDDKFDWFADDLGVGETSGDGVIDGLKNIGEKGSSMAAGLLPWMVPSLATANILAAGGNGFAQTYDEAIAAGADPQTAYDKAAQSGILNLLGAKLMQVMPIQKFLSGFGIKGAPKSVDGLVKKSKGGFKGLVDDVATGRMRQEIVQHAKGAAEMGGITAVQDFLNSLVRQSARGEELDFEEAALEGLEAGVEGAAVGLGMAGIHAAEHGVRRKQYREAARRKIVDWQENAHPEELRSINREKFDELAAKRKEGKDISRSDAEAAGLSPELGKDWRNGVFDEYNETMRERRTKLDAQQVSALNEAIAERVGEDGRVGDNIRERVLEKLEDANELDDPQRREELVDEAIKDMKAEPPSRVELPEDVANPDLGVRDVTSKAKADEPPPQKPPAEAPRSAPKEEGITTPPKATEGAEGGKTVENGVPKAETPAEPAKTEPEAPEKPAPTPTERTASAETGAKTAEQETREARREAFRNDPVLQRIDAEYKKAKTDAERNALRDAFEARVKELQRKGLKVPKDAAPTEPPKEEAPKADEIEKMTDEELKKRIEDVFNNSEDMEPDEFKRAIKPYRDEQNRRKEASKTDADRQKESLDRAFGDFTDENGKPKTITQLIDNGWRFEKKKVGVAHRYRLVKDGVDAYHDLSSKKVRSLMRPGNYDLNIKAIEEYSNSVHKPDAAETPKPAEAKPAKAEADAEAPKPSYSPSKELVEAKARIEAMPTDSDKQRSAKKKAQKDWLLSSVDDAINSHGNADVEDFIKEYSSLLRRRNATWEKAKAEKLDEQIEKARERFRSDEMITFDVPDDGTFKVYNTPEALALFKRNVQKRLSPTSLKDGTISKAEKPLAEDIKEAGVGMKVGDGEKPTGKEPGRVEARTPEEEIEERLDLRRLDPKRRSDPKVLEWAKKQGRTVTDGMATPDAVRAYDEAMTEAAAKVVNKRWFPDMKIVTHKFGEKIKRGQHVLDLRDTAGRALGWFDPKSKEVHLLPGADPQTVAHEIMWHGTRQYMTERAAKGDARAQKFLDMMHDVEKNAPQDIKDIVNRLYMRGGVPVDRDTLLNEYGAWFTMRRGGYALEKAMQKAENRNWFAKGLHAVKEMFKDFLIRHGRNRVDISKVDGMTRDEFVDFLADQFASGKTLGNIKEDKPALSTKETWWQKWRRKTYDQNAAVRDLQRDVEKLTGRKIAEADNVEMANALKYGLKEAANMDIQGRMRTLREKLHDGGIHFADLEYYAACKAAAGRDAKIDKRNLDKLEADMKAQGATPDEIDAAKAAYRSSNGSHIDPREARRVVAEIESGSKAQAYKDALAELRKTIDETLQTQVDAGLVSKESAAQWRAEEPDYVPFKNEYDPENGGWNGRGSSMSNFVAPEHRMAKGRQSAAGDIIAHVFMDHQAARHRAIENAVRQKLAKLVKAHPELGKVEKLKADAVKNVEQSDPNVVIFKQGGDSYAIRLEGTRGAAVANAFTGRETLDMKWADKGFSVYGKKISFRNFTRWSAGMATRYSPTFALRNTLKDNIELANIVYSERGPLAGSAWMGKYVANRAKMAKTLAKYVATGRIDTASAEGAILDRYIKAGGLIAGGTRSEAFSSIKDRLDPKAIEKEMRRGKSKVAAAARHTLNSIAYLNEYAEMATRVGIFATEVKGGKSDAEAALFSRRATVDFNRHGDWTPGFNLVRMFSNSTLGATARAAAALGKSKYGMVATGMMFANGLAQALIEHYANADEDKERAKRGEATGKDVSEFDRRTSLFYFRSGDRLYRIAQHESPFSLVKYAGDCVGRWLCGEISGKQMAKNLGVNAAEIAYNFLPMGSINLTSRKDNLTEDFKAAIVSGIVPSALQPIAEIAFDMDFKGDPVTKKLFDDFASRSHNGKAHTPSWAKATAEWIQEHTGGNAGNHKGLDVAPEVIQKLVEGYGKNLLKDVSTAFSVGEAIVKNDYSGLDPRNTPVKRDFVRPLDGNTQRYYSAMGNYKGDRKELLAMIPNWTAEERKAFVKEHPWAAAPEVDKMIQKIGELQKLEDGYRKADKRGKWVKAKEPPTEEQKEKWKAARLRYQAKFLEIAEKHGGEH